VGSKCHSRRSAPTDTDLHLAEPTQNRKFDGTTQEEEDSDGYEEGAATKDGATSILPTGPTSTFKETSTSSKAIRRAYTEGASKELAQHRFVTAVGLQMGIREGCEQGAEGGSR